MFIHVTLQMFNVMLDNVQHPS